MAQKWKLLGSQESFVLRWGRGSITRGVIPSSSGEEFPADYARRGRIPRAASLPFQRMEISLPITRGVSLYHVRRDDGSCITPRA
ncbi:hypothetical protein L195_g043818 [Trifolium pratense]|uniref:Uncharacterized protein n=1 Tax=Trifolium pratense TaxID=57577 RepID=A0A2K3MAB0_TRIPR|nr:hypothetical protein L195_g043818 [Trifolium pratense]